MSALLPLSVVIPVRNAEDLIDGCLASVLANRPAEVIVVDGASTDGTLERVRHLSHDTDIEVSVLDDQGSGVAGARMLGLARAGRPSVALIDADVVLGEGVLGRWLEEFHSGDYAGLQADLDPVQLTGGYWGRSLAIHQRIGRSRLWFGLSAAIVDRDTVLSEGLDPRFRSGEDIEWRHRMQRAGRRVAVSREVLVTHRFRDTWRDARHQWREDGAGLARMVRKNGVRDLPLLAMPAVAFLRGLALTLPRHPTMAAYWLCFLVFNYVALLRTILSPSALTPPGADPSDRLGLAGNSSALSAARVAPMAIGFVTWTLAARSFDPTAVGLAAAALAGAALISQVAATGQGHALVQLVSRQPGRADRLVDDGTRLAALIGLGSSVLMVLLAHSLAGLGGLVVDPLTTLLLLALGTSTALAYFHDHVAVARHRSDRALARSLVQAGVLLVVVVLALGASATQAGLQVLLTGATGGALASAGLGWWYERTSRGRRRTIGPPSSGELLTAGGAHLVLTVASRAPMFGLPFVITELVSPASNAAWYAAWMMSMAVWFVPNSVACSLQARLARGMADEFAEVRRAMRTALWLGTPMALGAAVLGPMLLAVMGPAYEQAAVPLWILLATLPGVLLSETWLAVARARGRWRGPALLLAGVGLAVVVAAAAASGAGLVAVAIVWLAGQSLLGTIGLGALIRLLREESGTPAPDPEVAVGSPA